MDVVHVVQGWDPKLGGGVAYFREISFRLAAAGHRVRVLTTNACVGEYFWKPQAEHTQPGKLRENGVEVWRFPVRHLPFNHWKLARALALLRPHAWGPYFDPPTPWVPDMHRHVSTMDNMPNIIHGTGFSLDSPLWAARKLARRADCPLLLTPLVHFGRGEADTEEIERFYHRPHQKKMLTEASVVFVLTKIEGKWAIKLGARPDAVRVTGIGINPDEVTGGNEDRFRQRHNIEGPILLHIATRSSAKGSDTVIEAAKRLWRRGEQFSLVMAGPQMAEFRSYLKSQQNLPEDTFKDLGYISDGHKCDAFAAADIFAMPSKADAFGIVYLEAWANEVPVIGADAGGVPDVIDDGRDGFLVPYGNVDELADRIQFLLHHRQSAHEMGSTGRRKVLSNYTWDHVYDRLYQAYTSVCGRSFGTMATPAGAEAKGE